MDLVFHCMCDIWLCSFSLALAVLVVVHVLTLGEANPGVARARPQGAGALGAASAVACTVLAVRVPPAWGCLADALRIMRR